MLAAAIEVGHLWRTMRRLLPLLSLAWLAGCGAEPPPPPIIPPALPPIAAPAPAPPPPPVPGLCEDLVRVVAAEAGGFAGLRGQALGGRTGWAGAVVPHGFRACRVEGSARPVAAYVCEGQPIKGGSGGLLASVYVAVAEDIAACLGRTTWYPRAWRRGAERLFGRGERQTTWRDVTANPKPALQLKIEEDFVAERYYLRLAVVTLG